MNFLPKPNAWRYWDVKHKNRCYIVLARNKEEATPLHLAAVNGIEEVCELLISEGADLKAVAVNGHTPLSLATVQGNREVVILLRRHLASRR